MADVKNKAAAKDDSLIQNQQMQLLLFRVLPYWPLIIFAIFLGFLGARIYLRYTTKIYAIKARVIVNDDSQQKTANLVDIVQLDTRNMSTETEKEMEILRSRNLLAELVQSYQLNVQYGTKGYIVSGENYKQLPFELKLQSPDSVLASFSGDVKIEGNKIRFGNVIYPCDTFIETKYGEIKWHINPEFLKKQQDDWYVKVYTIDTTVTQIQNSLTIEPISKQSSILSLTYNDVLPDRGVYILSGLLSLYGSSTIDYKSRMSENTLKFLNERLKIVAGELSGVEKNLQDYKTSNKIIDLSSQGNVILDQVKANDSKMSELDIRLDVLNKIKEYVIRRNNADNPPPATLGVDDPVLMALLNQLFQAEFELQKTIQMSGNKNPKIEVLQETIDKLKPSILTSINNLRESILVSRRQLEKDNGKLGMAINNMPAKERQLLDISRQQGIKNDIYTFLLQKKEEAAITAAGVVANYRIIDRPEVSGKVRPREGFVYVIAVLLSVILVAVFIYIKEFSSTLLKFRSQIEDNTRVPIIGEINYQEHDASTPVVVEDGKRSRIAEEFRELRTSLNYITFDAKEDSRIILITSSIPNEGKSFVAVNISISLTLIGKKVVLLEFDLRKPKISKQFGIKRNAGLSTFLIGETKAENVVQPIESIPGFHIIPSGPIPPNPSELISGSRLHDLFKYLKEHFDYIIIDSPPVASVTDAKILAAEADATLYIMRQNYTDSSFVDLVNDLQERAIFRNMNIVFNGIKNKTVPGYGYAYGFGYKYGYGYGYGYGYYSEEKQEKKKWFWWKK